jgi:hypothetical protein
MMSIEAYQTGIRVPLDTEGMIKLCKQFSVKELSLFGSILRDDFDRLKSDIDILVEFLPESTVESLIDFINVKLAFSDLLGYDVDLVEKRALSPYIRDDVLNSRRVVYVFPQ